MLFMVDSMYVLPNQEKAAACSFDQDFGVLFHVITFYFSCTILEFKELLIGNAKMEWCTV